MRTNQKQVEHRVEIIVPAVLSVERGARRVLSLRLHSLGDVVLDEVPLLKGRRIKPGLMLLVEFVQKAKDAMLAVSEC